MMSQSSVTSGMNNFQCSLSICCFAINLTCVSPLYEDGYAKLTETLKL